MPLKDRIKNIIPDQVLDWNRERKKRALNEALAAQKESGDILTRDSLSTRLRNIGLQKGDVVMVHSAMSKIGYLQDGPETFVNALFDVIGKEGTLCMPSSPVKMLQLDYIKGNPEFDVGNTPSAMGAITEYFRLMPETKRSLHPTEPVCASGPLADQLTKDHFGCETPYTVNSPWKKLMEADGKILYVGVTLDNAGTHLHTLEDAVDFKYPVYVDKLFDVTCIDSVGNRKQMKTRVHNPDFSKRRKCDGLIPMFMERNVLTRHQVGKADCLLLDAQSMFDVMVEEYLQHGITMYTPNGEKIKGYDE